MFAKMKQGWHLTKKSWSVVRSHPRLLKLTITGGVIAILVAIAVGGPGAALAAADDPSANLIGYVLLAIAVYLASFVVIFYNVALAAGADDALAGREPDLDAARQQARRRLPVIAGWALVSVLVSVLLNAIRQRGGAAGNLLGSLGAAAWGFVTFFVVPVVALEGVGPIAAVKRSAELVRSKWGQQVTGNVAIGGIAVVVQIVGAVVLIAGIALLISGALATAVLGAVLAVFGAVVLVGAAVVAGAMRGVFGVALYRFGVDDQAVGPFERSELAAAAS